MVKAVDGILGHNPRLAGLKIIVTGAASGMGKALPYLRAANEATIVNIASMGGIITPPLMAAYGASEDGLIGLTKGQATEWAPDIRANAICPGVITTPMTDLVDLGEEGDALIVNGVGAKRKGTPLEVGYLALFLTGRESSFISGSVYTIYGGPPFPYDLKQTT